MEDERAALVQQLLERYVALAGLLAASADEAHVLRACLDALSDAELRTVAAAFTILAARVEPWRDPQLSATS